MDTTHIEHFPPTRAHRTPAQRALGERMNLTIADEMIEAFEMLGYQMAFGIPGGGIANFFHSLSLSTRISNVLTQHELGAAYMAMGRTLASRGRSIGLCFATSGPGITNMITGIAAADQERVPIFVVSGNVATRLKGKGAVQDGFESGLQIARMLEPVTAKSIVVESVEDAVSMIGELDALAKKTRRPVHLNLPSDIAHAPARGRRPNVVTEVEHASATRGKWQSVVQQISHAERPVILAGHGVRVSGLEKALINAVEKSEIPVVVTSHAKGIVPDDHPLFFGCYGFAASGASTEFLKRYDPTCIVYLGTRLGELSSSGWSELLGKPEMRVHVDRDPTVFGRSYAPTHALCGEIDEFLQVLADVSALEPRRRKTVTNYREQLPRRQQDRVPRMLGPVNPEDLVRLLDLYLPENAAIFSDIGNTMAWLIHYLSVGRNQDFHVPLGLGSMGSGLCSAIGAKTVHRDRPVICITGDCSALMHGMELFSALRAGLAVKVIVLNDGGHGMVHHGMNLVGLEGTQVRFQKRVDFSAFGSLFGLKTYRVQSLEEFVRLPLRQIFESTEPVVVEVEIDSEAMPPIGARAKVVAGAEQMRKV